MEARTPAAIGHALYDREATKKPARLKVNSDLCRRQGETWLEENREAIEAYNEHIAQHGVFSAGLRGF
jgi:antitoxin CcdA